MEGNLGCSAVFARLEAAGGGGAQGGRSDSQVTHRGCPRLWQGAMKLNDITWEVNIEKKLTD